MSFVSGVWFGFWFGPSFHVASWKIDFMLELMICAVAGVLAGKLIRWLSGPYECGDR